MVLVLSLEFLFKVVQSTCWSICRFWVLCLSLEFLFRAVLSCAVYVCCQRARRRCRGTRTGFSPRDASTFALAPRTRAVARPRGRAASASGPPPMFVSPSLSVRGAGCSRILATWWRNGSAFDSRSKGWGFDSLSRHKFFDSNFVLFLAQASNSNQKNRDLYI